LKRDEAGTLAEITPERIRNALSLVKRGLFYRLDRTLENGIPVPWPHGPFQCSLFWRAYDYEKKIAAKNRIGINNCRLDLSDHTGTHIDALNHASIGDKLYSDIELRSIVTPLGTERLGAEKLTPIVTRGVLADIAKTKKVSMLRAGQVIEPEDIEECLEQSKTYLQIGDALLIRTGWGKLWMKDNEKYLSSMPGIGLRSARWLAKKRVCVIGADQSDVEVVPAENKDESDPVHQFLITRNGIPLIENLDLEALGKKKIFQFLLVCIPLRIKGATASPIAPIAVF
jgi:kynurenine formamidase